MKFDDAADYLATVEILDPKTDIAIFRLAFELREHPIAAAAASRFKDAFTQFQRSILEHREDIEERRFEALSRLSEVRRKAARQAG